jgi:hypothetical protein
MKLAGGASQSLVNALDRIEAHVGPVLDVWGELTPAQRVGVLAHSPVLARIVALGERMRVVNP